MWNNEYQKIGNGHDLMHVRVQKNKCAENIQKLGERFLSLKIVVLVRRSSSLLSRSFFCKVILTGGTKHTKSFQEEHFNLCPEFFLESPHKKTLSIPHTNMCLMLRTKNFRKNTLGGKYRIVGKCDIGQVFAIFPIALAVAQLGNARKGALSQ